MKRRACALALAAIGAWPAAARADVTKDECIAANEAAQVAQRDAHLLHARAELRICVAASCPDAIKADCLEQLRAVERAIPSIVIDATDQNGSPISALRVSVDGAGAIPLAASRAIELDPGAHSLVVTRDGSAATASLTVTTKEGEREKHLAVAFADAAPAPTSTATGGAGTEGTAPRAPITALIVGGAGAVSVVVGIVFWRNAISNNDASFAGGHCDASGCDSAGKGLRNDALTDASVATVTMLLGVAAIAGGGVLFYLGQPKAGTPSTARLAVRPLIGAAGGGFAIGGGW